MLRNNRKQYLNKKTILRSKIVPYIKSNFIQFSSIFLFATSIVIRVTFSGILSSKNEELNSYYQQKISLQKDIAALSFNDSQLSSMEYIREASNGMGFSQMSASLISIEIPPTSPLAINSLR